MKLQQGDYVTDLTEEQFDELIEIEQHDVKLTFKDYELTDNILGFNGYCFNTMYEYLGDVKTHLSFTEFKQRAINTFER